MPGFLESLSLIPLAMRMGTSRARAPSPKREQALDCLYI
jgi:hypothetical protein